MVELCGANLGGRCDVDRNKLERANSCIAPMRSFFEGFPMPIVL
jgi:hypothetical protein